jgi:hypothetical protein
MVQDSWNMQQTYYRLLGAIGVMRGVTENGSMDFHWNANLFHTQNAEVWLKADRNNTYFTQRPKYIYD